MEFYFQLTVWECMICGIRRASGRLLHILSEVLGIYERCGTYPRTVRIEDGSIFVTDKTDTREYLCRGIQEFRKRGRIYWIVMTGRVGNPVQLFLPVRVVGDEQAQKEFWKYLNDQRRVSGDKLVMSGGSAARVEKTEALVEAMPEGGRHIFQRWDLDRLSRAIAESLWIRHHCMRQRRWKDWGMDYLPLFLLFAVLAPVSWYLLGEQTIPLYLALAAMLGFRTSQEWRRWEQISMKEVCRQVGSWGCEIYEEKWELLFSSDHIKRNMPQMQNIWEWDLVGFLMETEDYYFFYTKQQRLMFYVNRELFGDWMAQKQFVQECQRRGICYQIVYPKILMDLGLPVMEQTDKIRRITDHSKEKQKQRRRDTDTQEGWRKFWVEKEKERGSSDKKQIVMVIAGIAALFALAFLLPEYGGIQGFEEVPIMMDMPEDGSAYEFHPGAYKDYVPLEKQVEVLESLGFQIPETVVGELLKGMDEMPESRVWVEGYPYTSLLLMLGMPERDYEKWEMKSYPDQAYWFDWEGFDMSREYVYILNGVNAMADGELTITDARQEMSDADWEKGRGIIHLYFSVNGEPYEYNMKLENDWIDPDIIRNINDAFQTSGIEKRVYAMGDGGQGCILLYGDKDWAKAFEKATGIKLETR